MYLEELWQQSELQQGIFNPISWNLRWKAHSGRIESFWCAEPTLRRNFCAEETQETIMAKWAALTSILIP